ncbi:MAG: msrB [Candidatus Parcubacteria bacterium]|nr:msrB [Candidatus Parcubacteria bacterium]
MNIQNSDMNEEELRAKLTPEEYHVLREKGTEAPGSGALLHEKRAGTYMCKVCGQALFPSTAKFESGTGWPSFDQALPGAVKLETDMAHGMRRMEVICSKCGSHLGHVFNDGPTDTGERYCMNSVCLELRAEEGKK